MKLILSALKFVRDKYYIKNEIFCESSCVNTWQQNKIVEIKMVTSER